ncbi:putative transcription factor MYB-HB-like family [Medicago truncatula]|uniref:Myb transcription factor n=1 Tax=Medicago truncatula TaxID=3880 RepID=A0A072V6B3_MEDTR|nr:transcription factor CPC [Medicago truncatula]KEH36848.1 myb transcription factor [Medicago truncatula]RHN72501.1 putative transcription factor MYB-HB-like family [Medicago truncatula]
MSDSKYATTANNGQYVSSDQMNREDVLEFSPEEEDIVAKMFRLVGKRWHLIAGRIPGRTPEDIEKYWTSKFSSSTAC